MHEVAMAARSSNRCSGKQLCVDTPARTKGHKGGAEKASAQHMALSYENDRQPVQAREGENVREAGRRLRAEADDQQAAHQKVCDKDGRCGHAR
eukprot:1092922-Prymnesium_polylepis.2